MGGVSIEAKPQKIVAGLEPEVSFYNIQEYQLNAPRNLQNCFHW